MDDERALLQSCLVNPDDDAPWLVFVDWLLEHHKDWQAEFIRLLARMPPGMGRRYLANVIRDVYRGADFQDVRILPVAEFADILARPIEHQR